MKLLQITALALCFNIPVIHAGVPGLLAPLAGYGSCGFVTMGVNDLNKIKKIEEEAERTTSLEEGLVSPSEPAILDRRRELSARRYEANVNFAAGAAFGTISLAAMYTLVTGIYYLATHHNNE
jgi:hypothetical protein